MKNYLPLRTKLCAIILSCFLFCNTAKAQYVNIPDATFVSWLQSNGYAGCMSGSQLDTTCSAVVNATGLYCSAVSIRNLTGIQYFKHLDTLDCSNDSLYYIPSFPAPLLYINCSSNNLDSLPVLPANLTRLDCYSNKISALPALPATLIVLLANDDSLSSLPVLPAVLNTLDCSYNKLTSLPALPAALNWLNCDDNQLTAVPALPTSLGQFYCFDNQITALPTLPTSLAQLGCGNNPLGGGLPAMPPHMYFLQCGFDNLTSLPALPAGLNQLNCFGNSLTTLPALPASLVQINCSECQIDTLPPLPASLTNLNCAYNQLTSMPPLPAGLQQLLCFENQLTNLPDLPATLTDLECEFNNLTSLPALPDSLNTLLCYQNASLTCMPELKRIVTLDFSLTAVTCIPNYGTVTNSNPGLGSVPLCGIYNGTGCQPFWNISGQAYYDQNADCQFDSIDVGTNYVKTQLYSNGTLVQQTFSGGEGYFSFDSVPNGIYTAQVDTSNLPFTLSCNALGYYNDTLNATDTMIYNNNFAFTCRTQGFDVGVQSVLNNYIPPRPNTSFTLYTIGGDMSELYGARCAAGINGNVQITYSGPITYLGPATGALAPTLVSGNTIVWVIPDFGAVSDFTAFNLLFKIDSLAVPGTSICFNDTIGPFAGDYNLANNTLSYCFPVVASLDPNEKEAYPSGVTDTSVQWLTYTIRFQNTGNAAAVNVRITDTLDSHLDPSTFQLLAYSAKNLTQIFGNDVVFNFPNINLPDSATSDSASRGYIQFKVKLKNNLPVGTRVQNTADIYFDSNPAVVTNTTLNIIGDSTSGINGVDGNLQFALYPNPAKNYVIVETDESAIGGNLQITDITGRPVFQSEIRNPKSEISTTTLTGGVYLVCLRNTNGCSAIKKLVVQ